MKKRYPIAVSAAVLTAGALMTGRAPAGNLDPTTAPDDPGSAMVTLSDLFHRLDSGAPGAKRTGGFVDPTNAPGGTGYTLDELMAKAPAVKASAATNANVLNGKVYWGLTNGQWGMRTGTMPTRTLSAANATVAAGYYAATTLTAVDADLAGANIKANAAIFGVVGTFTPNETYSSAVPKTGQTTSYQTGDDGYYKKGVPWPNPRFTVWTDMSSNCVTDNLTGLMWLKNPDATTRTWATAITCCEGLDGTGGRGGYTDWRLPNARELFSLIDFGRTQPALPHGHPFIGFNPIGWYWSSTTYAGPIVDNAWSVDLSCEGNWYASKTTPKYVWPVRGGR